MSHPSPTAVVELLKPITWFPPMWAFGCGVIASGAPLDQRWPAVLTGVAVAGPLVCGTSQAVNDWYDRHVDAINEPSRPIPSGRIQGHWGLIVAITWTTLSLAVAWFLGIWGFCAAALGLALAWAYSAPPLRLKENGWWGNAACGLSYEGLAWLTGTAVMSGGGIPNSKSIVLALLYSIGAHGIMTLNDFKSMAGDRQMGIRSLPVSLGADGACRVACGVMLLPQLVVVVMLSLWQAPLAAFLVGLLIVWQIALMRKLLSHPVNWATWYSARGVTLFVLGMLISAIALRTAPL